MTGDTDVTDDRGLSPEQFHAQESRVDWHRGTSRWHDRLEVMSFVLHVGAATKQLLQAIGMRR